MGKAPLVYPPSMTLQAVTLSVASVSVALSVALAFYADHVVGDVATTLYLVGLLVGIALSWIALIVAHLVVVPWLESRRRRRRQHASLSQR
jgi:ferric iron reductase protein FhuF